MPYMTALLANFFPDSLIKALASGIWTIKNRTYRKTGAVFFKPLPGNEILAY